MTPFLCAWRDPDVTDDHSNRKGYLKVLADGVGVIYYSR